MPGKPQGISGSFSSPLRAPLPHLPFNNPSHSACHSVLDVQGGVDYETPWRRPRRPVGLWCEQRCRVTRLKWAVIVWQSLGGVELQHCKHQAHYNQCGRDFSAVVSAAYCEVWSTRSLPTLAISVLPQNCMELDIYLWAGHLKQLKKKKTLMFLI